MNNFVEFIEGIFGEYQPIVQFDDALQGYVTYADWGYIASVLVYLIVVFFFFKTLGGIIYEWCRR